MRPTKGLPMLLNTLTRCGLFAFMLIFASQPCFAAPPESEHLEKPLADTPWEQSAIQYRLASSINGMNKAADPTWNPLVVHSLGLSPNWLVSDGVLLGANFEMAQEEKIKIIDQGFQKCKSHIESFTEFQHLEKDKV